MISAAKLLGGRVYGVWLLVRLLAIVRFMQRRDWAKGRFMARFNRRVTQATRNRVISAAICTGKERGLGIGMAPEYFEIHAWTKLRWERIINSGLSCIAGKSMQSRASTTIGSDLFSGGVATREGFAST